MFLTPLRSYPLIFGIFLLLQLPIELEGITGVKRTPPQEIPCFFRSLLNNVGNIAIFLFSFWFYLLPKREAKMTDGYRE